MLAVCKDASNRKPVLEIWKGLWPLQMCKAEPLELGLLLRHSQDCRECWALSITNYPRTCLQLFWYPPLSEVWIFAYNSSDLPERFVPGPGAAPAVVPAAQVPLVTAQARLIGRRHLAQGDDYNFKESETAIRLPNTFHFSTCTCASDFRRQHHPSLWGDPLFARSM